MVVNSNDETQDTLQVLEMEREEGAQDDDHNHSAQEKDVQADSHPPTLDPDALWFDHHSVTSPITEISQSFYDEPYTCWSNAKPDAKEFWWLKFQQSFKWIRNMQLWLSKAFKRKRLAALSVWYIGLARQMVAKLFLGS